MQLITQAPTELRNQLKLYCPEIVGDEKFISTWFGKQVRAMEEQGFKKSLNLAIAEVCILTGLQTYDFKEQNEMYVAQMRVIAKFIHDGFGYLTPAEITNAFHLNLQGKYGEVFKQYGIKQINCEFIGQVLSGYRNYKQSYINMNPDVISVIQPPPKIETIEYKEDVTNEERPLIEQQYQYFLKDPEWNCRLLPDFFYNRLIIDELIPDDFYKKFIRRSQTKLLREKTFKKLWPTSKEFVKQKQPDGSIANVLIKNFDMNKQIDSEAHQIRNGYSSEVNRYAKQIAVAGYFKFCLTRQMDHIYIRQ